MNVMLAVDPGIRGCGCAVFVHGRLYDAAYLTNPALHGNDAKAASVMARRVHEHYASWCVTDVALEWPRVYASRIRSGNTKADPNDLLGLAAVNGAIAMAFYPAEVTCYAPSDWKGQMTKDVCLARVMSRLDEEEALIVNEATRIAKSKAHNMHDAVGIGLHRLGRLERRRAA